VGNAAFLLIAVAIMALGLLAIGVWTFLNRPREDAGIHEFRSAIDALSVFHGDKNSRHRKTRR